MNGQQLSALNKEKNLGVKISTDLKPTLIPKLMTY